MHRERNGSKFTGPQRIEMRVVAWQLRQDGMAQRQIGEQLNVSQATVSNWLKRHAKDFPMQTTQERVALKIREELVCCEIFQESEALQGDLEAQQKLRESKKWHPICYYGEWAARIAEKVQ